MASLRIPSLRHLSLHSARVGRCMYQRRWAQVHDVRFLATVQPPRSIQDKYKARLESKAKSEGHGSIDDLKAAYSDNIQAQRQKDVIVEAAIPPLDGTAVSHPDQSSHTGLEKEGAQDSRPLQTRHTPKSSTSCGDKSTVKTLNDILDLEKARELPEKELTTIWRLRHAASEHQICAVIPSASYNEMERLARQSPQFVLPVPHKDQGAEIHFLQWAWDASSKTSSVLFTQLAEYKQRGEFAQPHTIITHHLDLSGEKGLVLMQGQVVEDRGVKPETAKWLVMSLQRFYGGWEAGSAELDGQRKERAEERKKLLEYFAAGDSRFSLDKLLEEAERMG